MKTPYTNGDSVISTEQEASMAVTAQKFTEFPGFGVANEHSRAVAACLAALVKAKDQIAEAKAREIRKLLPATTMNGG